MRSRLAPLCVVLLLAGVVPLAGQSSVLITMNALESYLDALRQQAGIPGLSALVVKDGSVIWERGLGYQNVEGRIRATPDTPYLVGGLSQTVASVLLLQCVEQRRFYLDDPVWKYGAALPEGATLRQVLSHTSASTPPGEAFNFDLQRFAQLTPVMEWCAPQPYRKSVAHRILNRLAMKDSVPGRDLDSYGVLPDGLFEQSDIDTYKHVLERLATPYKVDKKGRPERSDIPIETLTASNGLVSTVRDLAQLDLALDSLLLLQEDTLNAAWTNVASSSGTMFPTGLGWFVQSYRGEPVVWQFGQINGGYSSMIVKLPARHSTFIVLANSDGLTASFPLASGDITRSLFATLFLRLST